MKTTIFGITLLCLLGSLQTGTIGNAQSDDTATAYETVERDGIRVTFLEMATSQTPNGEHVSTSFLFMIEHSAETAGSNSHSAPIRIFDDQNSRLFVDATNGLPKTATTVTSCDFTLVNNLPNLPKPGNLKKTRMVRHSIASRIPISSSSVEVGFGINGNNKTYRFKLKPVNGG